MSGLSSLRRWQKCQRNVAKKVLRAAGRPASTAKHAELKRAANALASIACSKGTKKSSKRRGKRSKPFVPPDFSRQLAPPHYEPPFNPEVF